MIIDGGTTNLVEVKSAFSIKDAHFRMGEQCYVINDEKTKDEDTKYVWILKRIGLSEYKHAIVCKLNKKYIKSYFNELNIDLWRKTMIISPELAEQKLEVLLR